MQSHVGATMQPAQHAYKHAIMHNIHAVVIPGRAMEERGQLT